MSVKHSVRPQQKKKSLVTEGNAELRWNVVNNTSNPTLNDKDKNGTLNTFHSVNSIHFSLEWSRDPVEKTAIQSRESHL